MRRCRWLGLVLLVGGCAGPDPVPPPPVGPAVGPDEDVVSSYSALLGSESAYTLGIGDLLEIAVLDLEEEGKLLELEVEVAEDGRVPLPVLGPVLAEGKSPNEFRADLVSGLAERYLADPFVSVKVKEYKSRRIAVLGTVNHPGVHFLPRLEVSVNEALGLAGGLTDSSGLRAVVVHGGEQPSQRPIDLDALARGDVTQNAMLRHGDVLHVLPPDQFYVAGFVEKPGLFEFRHDMTVGKALSLAGGIQIPDASPDLTRIRRRGPDGEYFIQVDLNGILDDEVPDVQMMEGDVLEVRQSGFRYAVVGFYDAIKGLISVGVNAASLF